MWWFPGVGRERPVCFIASSIASVIAAAAPASSGGSIMAASAAEVPVLSTDTGFPPEMVGSREAKEFFDENGYMIVRGCLSPLEVSECAVTIRELHERAARGEPGSFGFETLARDQLTADGLPILRKIEQTGELSPVFHRLAEHPTLITAWQNAIGDDNLLLFRSTLMLKPAEHGSAHALHQGACNLLLLRGFIESLTFVLVLSQTDSAYWPLRPAGAAVAVSIALQDADESNGCCKIVILSRFACCPSR